MRKSVLFFSFVFSLLWVETEGMNPQELKDALINKSGYSILTVTRDYMENDNTILRKEDFSQVLDKIDEILKNMHQPVFVVFNEYFCSRKTLEYSHFREFLGLLEARSQTNPKAIYWVNFLHKLKMGISQTELDNLKLYISPLDDFLIEEDGLRQSWPPPGFCRNDNSSPTVNNDPQRGFANETFVVTNGATISSYRKSTYCNEDNALLSSGWSYYYGYATDALLAPENQLALSIHQNVYTDICLDVNSQIRRWTDKVLKNESLATYQAAIKGRQVLEQILKPSREGSINSFSLHIIQSNSTRIRDEIGFFPEPQVVVQSDPSASNVFLLQIPNHVKSFKTKHPIPKNWVYELNIMSMCTPYKVAKEEHLAVDLPSLISVNFTFLLYNIGR